jgi:rod shape-determining protein MreC
MQQIINFVIRNKTFLLFLLLFGISLALTIQSHSYHRSRFINSANAVTGGIYGTINSVDQYFSLKQENELLIEENKRLKEVLFNSKESLATGTKDSILDGKKYRITSAEVYKNSYSLTNNYLTLNKGNKDGIKRDFGVIHPKGIIGIIDNTSNGYSTVLSILNKKSRINAKLKATNHFGSLTWNGASPDIMQLIDVSKFAPVKVGDTIVSGGQSAIFPKGIQIGTVENFTTDIGGDTYTIDVRLFNDMTNIGKVYIIENTEREEIKQLEDKLNE